MGVYKKAVITDAGRALMARSTAGEAVMQFSRAVTSSYIYPSETDFKGYISLEEIQQAVIPSSVQVVNDTLISVRSLFGNESISESYLIQNIGLYATDGNEEILFSVSQAATPDEMPAYNGVAPSSFIYTIQATISQASSLSITINPAGTATTQDILDLDGVKLDKRGNVSETTVETLDAVTDEFPVPEAGEPTKGFMGKVRKFIQDFNAFKTGIITLGRLVNNGQTTEAGFALDARYGKTLYDLYAQLNANLAVTTGTVITTSYVTDATFELRKTGNIVYFSSRIGITLAGLSAAGQLIFTLPVNFRPAQALRIPCTVVINSEFAARELAINSSGTCNLQGDGVQSVTRLVFCATFVAA